MVGERVLDVQRDVQHSTGMGITVKSQQKMVKKEKEKSKAKKKF